VLHRNPGEIGEIGYVDSLASRFPAFAQACSGLQSFIDLYSPFVILLLLFRNFQTQAFEQTAIQAALLQHLRPEAISANSICQKNKQQCDNKLLQSVVLFDLGCIPRQ
jgi:hypothetical protein